MYRMKKMRYDSITGYGQMIKVQKGDAVDESG